MKDFMRVAVLDLYHQSPNQGMKGILKILKDFKDPQGVPIIQYDIFDVRAKHEIPGLEYDAYISTGGPGDPHYKKEAGGAIWGPLWTQWIDSIIDHNQNSSLPKKTVFLICHSFQMMCIHSRAAVVELRKSPSFGIFPMHKTFQGEMEDLFRGLPDPFYAVDSRNFQVLDPNPQIMEEKGIKILAYEKIRPHVPYDRAIMALRFTDEIMGTQFHPEADPIFMMDFFKTPEKKQEVVQNHGEKKYQDMLLSLEDPEKVSCTFQNLLPLFLKRSWDLSRPLLIS
jgi:GMP synthase-like glutamine amidotransferase